MKRILIANRGEIAVRLQKTIHKLGMETVAVYHDSEKNSSYAHHALFSCNLGNGSLSETFLNIPLLINIAKQFHCDAIHPGYGFLSENYLFAQACEQNNLIFIGPGSEAIRLMSSKLEAKSLAVQANIPVIKSIEYTNTKAFDNSGISFPIIIKAAAGGGGKGMRIVRNTNELKLAVENVRREALLYFADDKILIEPYMENARHIEVQIFGDNFGNLIHLFERECSMQRNHQKVIEESPAISIPEALKDKLFESAIRFASEINYTNAGTVEFLVNGHDFYFLEMNTRIQVEHAVTEMVTGIDLVEEQINISSGHPISDKLRAAVISGHAIEVRICAENPYKNFRPSTGKIAFSQFPSTIRVDTFIENNTMLTPFFDSMIAKMIVHGSNRNVAIKILSSSLKNMTIHGIDTNSSFLKQIVENNSYRENQISTSFLMDNLDILSAENADFRRNIEKQKLVIAFIIANFYQSIPDGIHIWQRFGASFRRSYKVCVDGQSFTCLIKSQNPENLHVLINGAAYFIPKFSKHLNKIEFIEENQHFQFIYTQLIKKPFDLIEFKGEIFQISSPQILHMALLNTSSKNNGAQQNNSQIVSPLFGKIIDVKVKERDIVKKGDVLLSIDSMKTENNILAPFEGTIEIIHVKQGSQVKENVELITMNPLN